MESKSLKVDEGEIGGMTRWGEVILHGSGEMWPKVGHEKATVLPEIRVA
jgi:hypothetical protein